MYPCREQTHFKLTVGNINPKHDLHIKPKQFMIVSKLNLNHVVVKNILEISSKNQLLYNHTQKSVENKLGILLFDQQNLLNGLWMVCFAIEGFKAGLLVVIII